MSAQTTEKQKWVNFSQKPRNKETDTNLTSKLGKIASQFPDLALKLRPMKSLHRFFTEHPASVGESYLQHLCAALSFAGPLLIAAVCATLHAMLPGLFPRTASQIVARLHVRMVTHRTRMSTNASTPRD
ncbi:DUF6356 family protein [Hylemonella sp. W303a]|uniref:DUF6356 family protein n=1 Tax=Hylemonella sp. W303a TaxID=3389873 RepID=UPI00396B28CB